MGLEEEELFGGGDAAAGADERRAFKREELIACERCGRASPPTRMKCLYCGAALPADEGGADRRRPALKPLEAWERGFNVVLAPRAGETSRPRDEALAEAAMLVRLEPEQLDEMIASPVALPLARTGERAEAELLERRMKGLGLGVRIVADDELAVEADPPRRVRKLEFGAGGVTGLSVVSGESWHAAWVDVVVMVVGRIFRKRIEVEERRKRRVGSEVVESRELVEDEAVVDLHFATTPAGWRVTASGFDYSCLGARKSLLASENFARLCDEFRARAPAAACDDAYRRVRHLLQFAWSPTEQREAGGVRRAGPGRVSTEAVTRVSNETQFTRYSRLLRHFALRPHDEQK